MLALDPELRPDVGTVMEHAYFTEEPLACNPGELPCSKEGHWGRSKRGHGK